MLSALDWDEVDDEQTWTLRTDVVRYVLPRRTADADLQRAVSSLSHVDCLHHIMTPHCQPNPSNSRTKNGDKQRAYLQVLPLKHDHLMAVDKADLGRKIHLLAAISHLTKISFKSV